MDFSRFECLSFDCYGTLIDWESGIASALRPVLETHDIQASRDSLLELYGEAEAEVERGPYRPYREGDGTLDGVGQSSPRPLGVRSDPSDRGHVRPDGSRHALRCGDDRGHRHERHSVMTEQMGETDHFYYRLQPEGVYIDSQRDNKAFGYADGKILLSEDNGKSWPHSAVFPNARNITFSLILRNGNVLFATRAKLYLGTDDLQTVQQITVKDADGSDYIPHTPVDPELPGWYFHTIPGINSWDVNGTEMVVWGNYCNVLGGASPVNIYYSTDNGRTVKIAYAFGQNPYNHDDGSNGGGTSGTSLGNPDNPVICRHVHTVAYSPAEDAFYACTGDQDKPEGFECHWLRGTYDADGDRWAWEVVVSDHLNSRYKAGGISFVDGELYWISDSNGPEPYDRGIFKCAPEDLTRPEKHTLLFNPEVESGNLIIQDGVFLASHCAPASPMATGIIVSLDGGETWAQHDLAELGQRSPTRFHEKNSEGWFRMDLRSGWVAHAEVLFLKPKDG